MFDREYLQKFTKTKSYAFTKLMQLSSAVLVVCLFSNPHLARIGTNGTRSGYFMRLASFFLRDAGTVRMPCQKRFWIIIV